MKKLIEEALEDLNKSYLHKQIRFYLYTSEAISCNPENTYLQFSAKIVAEIKNNHPLIVYRVSKIVSSSEDVDKVKDEIHTRLAKDLICGGVVLSAKALEDIRAMQSNGVDYSEYFKRL